MRSKLLLLVSLGTSLGVGVAPARNSLGAQVVTGRRAPPSMPRPSAQTVELLDMRPPGAAPTGVTATASGPTSVELRWTAPPGAVGYIIYRNTTPLLTQPIAATSYVDHSVVPKSALSYAVAAVYAPTAQWSPGTSAGVRVTTPAGAAPASVRAAWSDAGVVLDWPAAPGASGYLLLRDRHFVTTQPIRATTYTDRGLAAGSYRYQVAAYYGVQGGTEVEGELDHLPAVRVSTPIRGIADTHSHPFANLAAGGFIFWGEAYGPIEKALGSCAPIHGTDGAKDLVGNFKHLTVGHKCGGYPLFEAWPSWNTLTHQQMYSDWIYRAYQGGLRLLVAHAVNNSTLCVAYMTGAGNLGRCDDMQAVNLQLAAAKGMETYIDAQGGGPGKGWFRIAYTPEQARQIIYSGKLAVVLGIEVDQLFGCGVEGGCDDATVDRELDRYYNAGVRHLLPIHLANNGFGGYAHYENLFLINNYVETGKAFDGEPCEAEGYRMPCNTLGLTPLGEHLLTAMMSRGMIIDVNHMSRRSADRALEIAAGRYPVIAGHTGFLGISLSDKKSEGQETDVRLESIRAGGGMVSPILHQGDTTQTAAYRTRWNRTVLNDCGESSKSWAQAYLYAVDHMGGWETATVGIGSDQMLNELIAPRFRQDGHGCAHQARPVQYPFTPLMPGAAPMGQSVAGNRTFDFNLEGLAHYGMLPDFIQDLQNIGLTTYDLEPLFRSAEGYIRMWERATSAASSPHTASAAGPSAP
jgi:microsomal dipeptidase-like Zn-dependent dipeptidase